MHVASFWIFMITAIRRKCRKNITGVYHKIYYITNRKFYMLKKNNLKQNIKKGNDKDKVTKYDHVIKNTRYEIKT